MEITLSWAVCLQLHWNKATWAAGSEITTAFSSFGFWVPSPCSFRGERFLRIKALLKKIMLSQQSQHIWMQLQAFCKLFDILCWGGKLPGDTKSSLSGITLVFNKPKLDRGSLQCPAWRVVITSPWCPTWTGVVNSSLTDFFFQLFPYQWFLGSLLVRLHEVGPEPTVTQLLFQPDYGRALQGPQRGNCDVEHHGGNR